MKLEIQVASTSQTINIFIQDSSSTTGAGLTGLVFNSAGLTAYYALPRAAAASITLATLAAVTSSYSSGGFKEVDATNMPGWYRFDVPNAALASGLFVSIHLKGATNMAPLPIEIQLTGWDPLVGSLSNAGADGILDRANGIEPNSTPFASGLTLRQAMRLMVSACAAIISGAATTTLNVKDMGNTKNRIVATVDASGNRSAITYDIT